MKYSDEDDNQNSTTFTRYATTMVDYFEPPCKLSVKNDIIRVSTRPKKISKNCYH